MREIFFRGKRIDNGEWAYGVPLIGKTSGVFMVWMQGESKGSRGGISIRDVVKQSEVISETVGQDTGLKDKDGQKIFEGDILNGMFQFGGVGWYDTGEGMYQINHPVIYENGKYTCYAFNLAELCSETEVIGNITDNKEFLEVE